MVYLTTDYESAAYVNILKMTQLIKQEIKYLFIALRTLNISVIKKTCMYAMKCMHWIFSYSRH